MNEDNLKEKLVDIVKNECNNVYLSTICPLMQKYGLVFLGIADYFVWLTNENIDDVIHKGIDINNKDVIENATQEELLNIISYSYLFDKFYNSDKFDENIGWIIDLMKI